MPNTPVIWKAPSVVNATTAGNQYDPEIVQLLNGNVLVIWTSDNDTGAGAPFGTDVIGQIFDAAGNPLGGEFRLNIPSANNERNADIAALPDGGFMVVYEDDRQTTTSEGTSIQYSRYNSGGVHVGTAAIFLDDANGGNTFGEPHIAVSGNTARVVYEASLVGGTAILSRSIDLANNNTLGNQISVIGVAGLETDPDITTLKNGNFLVTCRDATVGAIYYRIMQADGTNVRAPTVVAGTDTDGLADSEPTAVALSGGGFVIAWTQHKTGDTDVVFRIYDASGAETGAFQVNGAGTGDNRNEPAIAALADGGFVVVVDDDVVDDLRAQHYSASGVLLGSEAIAVNADVSNITALGLADGRVQIAYRRLPRGTGEGDLGRDNDNDIGMVILDTRDAVNTAAGGRVQVGTIGDDVFTQGGFLQVYGGAGNDVITESSVALEATIYGEAGDDVIKVVSGFSFDGWDGGSGTDTIDWRGSPVSGATFDLAAGFASNSFSGELMAGFENLIGSNRADIIRGTAGNNLLDGADGDDSLVGGAGGDTLIGGLGIDTAWYYDAPAGGRLIIDMINGANGTGDAAGDSFDGVERVVATAGDDVIYGTDNTDYIVASGGNDDIVGRGGADVIDGGAGLDTLWYFSSAGRLVVDLLNDANNGGEAAGDAIFNVERLVGTEASDAFFGTDGSDYLLGQGGNDDLIGRGGADGYDGGAGFDTVWYTQPAAAGTFLRIDMLNAGASSGEAYGDVFSSIERIVGTEGQEYFFGSAGDDAFTGLGGADAMEGRGGNDVLDAGAGNDRIAGGAGADTLLGGTGLDAFVYFSATDGGDRIIDFATGVDHFEFVGSAFGLAAGAVGGDYFVSGAAPTAAHGQFLWNSATRTLSWDADGAGAQAAVMIATLDTGSVAAGDLLIV